MMAAEPWRRRYPVAVVTVAVMAAAATRAADSVAVAVIAGIGGYGGGGGGGERFEDESVFSRRVRAGKRRTYFFDVKKTRGDDYFITITESTRREDGFGYKRHKLFLYKEDFNRFWLRSMKW